MSLDLGPDKVMKKIPGVLKAFMLFAIIYGLLWLAQFIASPTLGHGINAAGSMALAVALGAIIWRTYTRKRD